MTDTAGADSARRDPGIPLTPVQVAYLRGADPDLPLGGVDCVAYLEFHGRNLDLDALPAAVQGLRRHPCLRSAVRDGRLREIPDAGADLEIEDLTAVTDDAAEGRLAAIREELRGFHPDLERGRTWAIRVSVLPAGRIVLHLVVSLVVTDLAGIGVMMHDLAQAMRGGPVQPRVDAPQLCARLSGRRSRAARIPAGLATTREDGLLPAPELPEGTGTRPGGTGHRLVRTFPAEQWARLEGRAHRLRVPLPALCLAVYEECLRRWSQNDRFIVTVTGLDTRGSSDDVADRTTSHLHRARPFLRAADLLRDVADEYRYRILKAVPATEELRGGLTSGSQRGPWPHVFTYGATGVLFDDLTLDVLGRPEHTWSITPQVALDCQIVRLDRRSTMVSLDVRDGALPDEVAADLFEAYCQSLTRLASGCDDELDGAGLVRLPEETVRARERVNATDAVSSGLLHAPFRDRVRHDPDGAAVVWDEDPTGSGLWRHRFPGLLTAAELDIAARRVAAGLVERTDPGDIVLVRLPKGPDQIVAVLGALYAGCAYLPCGVDQPEDRVDTIAEDAGARVRITEEWLAQLPERPLGQTRSVQDDQIAYVIYTSGSTGRPKGVAIRHRCAVNTVIDVNTRHGVGPADRTLAVSGLDFDLSVYDIFGPLSAGGAVVTISEEQRRDAFAWLDLVRRHRVTVWNTVPSLAEMLCIASEDSTSDAESGLPGLRMMICSGDWVRAELVSRIHERFPGTEVVAMGGATEASIWSNEFVADATTMRRQWRAVPYGTPLSGQKYRVADEAGRDRPDHVPGELWIGGTGVAAGYLGNPGLTAERFVESDGERWYRTGDRGVWLPGPLLVFLGRIDSQVKILGHRVECAEIEHTLDSLPGVDAAAVVDIRDRHALGAAVTGAGTLDVELLRSRMSRTLPPYMVPSVIRQVDALPHNDHGKVDRNRVRRLLETRAGADAAPDDTTGRVTQLWCSTLGVDAAHPRDNLFEIGGDSLAATRLCQRARAVGLEVPVADLFADPTFEGFARACAHSSVEPPPACPPAAGTAGASGPEALGTGFPLTPLQRSYAVGADGVDQVVRAAPVFGVRLATDDGGPVEIGLLHRVVQETVQRHEVLRVRRSDDVRQACADHAEVGLLRLSRDQTLRELTAGRKDWDAEPAIAVLLSAEAPDEVALRIPYLALDAASMALVVGEIAERYRAACSGSPVDPGRVAETSLLPFRGFAERTAALEADSRPPRDLPEPPRLPVELPAGADRTVSWSASLGGASSALIAAARRDRVSVSAVVLQHFAREIAQWCGQDTIGITVPVLQRPDPAEGGVLGNFTRLGLCTLHRDGTSADAARQLESAVCADLPDEIDIARAGRAAYPVVFTSTTGLGVADRLKDTGLHVVEARTSTPGVVIDCQLEWRDAQLHVHWDCPEGARPRHELEAVFDRFIGGLTGRPAAVAVPERDRPGQAAPDPMDDWALTTMGAVQARLDREGTTVAERFRPVMARWAAAHAPTGREADPAIVGTLVDCLAGRCHVSRLVQHPGLSPQGLMTRSDAGARFVELIAQRLSRDTGKLRVVEVGSGDGSVRRAVIGTLAQIDPSAPGRIGWESVEPDLLLCEVAAARGERPVPAPSPQPADLVVCLGGLHRDPRILDSLADVVGSPRTRLLVGELSAATPVSLLTAALLDPRIADPARTPLRDSDHWRRRLADAGWRVERIDEISPQAILLEAHRAEPAADPDDLPDAGDRTSAQSRRSGRPEDAAALRPALEKAWQRHLGVLPGPDSDFFSDGGDSLLATRMVTELRSRKVPVRLVDLFNAADFDELVRMVAGRRADLAEPGENPSAAAPHTGPVSYPLTAVQQAYLRGRDTAQILGGVGAHCYFEFGAEDLDPDALERATAMVQDRHPELRSVVRGSQETGLRMIELEASSRPAASCSPDPRGLTETEVPDPGSRTGLVVRYGHTPEGRRIIAVGMDNIHLDGASMLRVLGELGTAYAGRELPPASPPHTFSRYLQSRPWLLGLSSDDLPPGPSRQRMEAAEGWWRDRIPNLPPAPQIVPLPELAAVGRPTFDRVGHDIPAESWGRIRQGAASRRITPSALILAAFAEALAADLGQQDLSINLTRFDRDSSDPDVLGCVGDFTSLLPVGVHTTGDVVATARAVNATILDELGHPETSMAWISREILHATGEPGRALFPVVFTSGLGLGRDGGPDGVRRLGELVRARSQTPQTLVDLQCYDGGGDLRLTADHVTEILSADRVRGWLGRIAATLHSLDPVGDRGSADGPGRTEESQDSLVAGIVEIWSRCLPGAAVDRDTNFFRAGGDSIAATRCIQEIRTALGVEVDLRTLFLNPDLTGFVDGVRQCASHPQTTTAQSSGGPAAAPSITDGIEEGAL